MKLIHYLTLVLIALLQSCYKVEVKGPTSGAINIETNLPNKSNFIYSGYMLPNNHLLLALDEGYSAKLYLYDERLRFVKSIELFGRFPRKIVVEDDNTFTYILNDGNTLFAYKLDFNLNLVKTVDLAPYILYPPGGAPQIHSFTKLDNGKYIIGNHFWFNNYTQSKYSFFCISDIFGSPRSEWIYTPATFDGRWINEIYKADKGHFFVTGGTGFSNYIDKFKNDGTYVKSIDLPNVFTINDISTETDRFIYGDNQALYIFDYDFNPIDKIFTSLSEATASNIIEMDGFYYYTIDVFNTDGKHIEVRKTDKKFNIIKSKRFGNQNTNNSFLVFRYLFKQSTGKLVLTAQVENPTVVGNHWMLLKLDKDLELSE